jgi:hypothetical protein
MNKTSSKLLENTRRWRKTKRGLLTNLYQKLKTRHEVSFDMEWLHNFAECQKFNRLFNEWELSNHQIGLKPSLDRIDCKKSYSPNNVQWLTWSENRYKQSKLDGRRGRKPRVIQMSGNKVIKIFQSQRHVVKELGISQSNLSSVLNGKRKHVEGYVFIYENPELLK